MSGYGSKYFNVYFKIRAYCLQMCAANDERKMFKTINDSRNISPKEIIIVSKNTGKIMFGCGPKYFCERLKLKRVYKTYAL